MRSADSAKYLAASEPFGSTAAALEAKIQDLYGAAMVLDAPAVLEQRCAGLIGEMIGKGWQPPRSIDRVYDSSRAARDLGFMPRFGVESCLATCTPAGPAANKRKPDRPAGRIRCIS